MSFQAGHSATM